MPVHSGAAEESPFGSAGAQHVQGGFPARRRSRHWGGPAAWANQASGNSNIQWKNRACARPERPRRSADDSCSGSRSDCRRACRRANEDGRIRARRGSGPSARKPQIGNRLPSGAARNRSSRLSFSRTTSAVSSRVSASHRRAVTACASEGSRSASANSGISARRCRDPAPGGCRERSTGDAPSRLLPHMK